MGAFRCDQKRVRTRPRYILRRLRRWTIAPLPTQLCSACPPLRPLLPETKVYLGTDAKADDFERERTRNIMLENLRQSGWPEADIPFLLGPYAAYIAVGGRNPRTETAVRVAAMTYQDPDTPIMVHNVSCAPDKDEKGDTSMLVKMCAEFGIDIRPPSAVDPVAAILDDLRAGRTVHLILDGPYTSFLKDLLTEVHAGVGIAVHYYCEEELGGKFEVDNKATGAEVSAARGHGGSPPVPGLHVHAPMGFNAQQPAYDHMEAVKAHKETLPADDAKTFDKNHNVNRMGLWGYLHALTGNVPFTGNNVLRAHSPAHASSGSTARGKTPGDDPPLPAMTKAMGVTGQVNYQGPNFITLLILLADHCGFDCGDLSDKTARAAVISAMFLAVEGGVVDRMASVDGASIPSLQASRPSFVRSVGDATFAGDKVPSRVALNLVQDDSDSSVVRDFDIYEHVIRKFCALVTTVSDRGVPADKFVVDMFALGFALDNTKRNWDSSGGVSKTAKTVVGTLFDLDGRVRTYEEFMGAQETEYTDGCRLLSEMCSGFPDAAAAAGIPSSVIEAFRVVNGHAMMFGPHVAGTESATGVTCKWPKANAGMGAVALGSAYMDYAYRTGGGA